MKTQEFTTWAVMRNGECIARVTYLARCTESHVLACVRHEWADKSLSLVKE